MKKICCLTVLALAATAGSAHAGAFSFVDFSSTSGLTFVNDAKTVGNAVSLNDATGSSRGALWYTADKMGVASGFTTTFKFNIADRLSSGADGFAFVVQNTSPTAIGADGGGIGYGTNPVFNHQPGIANSVAVEFDVFNNTGGWADGSAPRSVSVQSRGTLENSPDAAYSFGSASLPDIGTGATHEVTIVYTPGIMNVLLDNTLILSSAITLDMLNLDAGRAWVGFTAATGGAAAAESHQIQSWSFNTVPTPGAGMLAIMGGLVASRRRRN